MASGASAGYLSIALVSFFSFIAHVSAITLAGALVINLDDDRARWNATLSQLASSVLVSSTPPGIVRIQGVAAESLDLHHLIVDGKLTRAAYNDIIAQDRIVTGDSLTLGALGCLQSHVLAWERIVELNQPALIFEDDVTISPDFDAGITLALHHLPDDFGLLYLANVIGDSVQKHLTPYDVSIFVQR